MTIGSIFLGLALLVLVGLFISRPLLRPDTRSKTKLTRYQALTAQKEAVLAQIRSLDFDYDTGKLTDADYHKTREDFMVTAEDIFRQLDELEEGGGEPQLLDDAPIAGPTSDLESEIEAAVARHRAQPPAAAPATSQNQPTVSNGKSNFCPECGQPIDPNDKFCANCGHKLLKAQHA